MPTTRIQRSFSGATSEVDAFAVYCRQTEGGYLIPMSDLAPSFEASLRVTPPRNNQRNGVRFASKYLVGTVSVMTVEQQLALRA